MQWNLRGEVNWYAAKSWGLLMIPLTTLLIFPLVFWLESRDRSRHRTSDGTLTAQHNLANSYADLGRHEEAERSYEEAIRLKRDYYGALMNFGLAELGEGRAVFTGA